jgi:hypothetical protein
MRLRASWRWIAAMAMASAGPFSGSVGAVVIDRVNAGSGNMSAPSDDPGWNNVGAIGVGGGVYIGYGWVLTANHVGSGDGITLGGVKYPMLPGTGRQLTNAGAAGKSALTDLFMFQIAQPSLSLPFIHVASTAPANGETVTMIGQGRLQQANPTFWDINDSVIPWVWTETTEDLANEAGFKTDGTKSMRWGTNAIDDRGWFKVGVDVLGLGTTFDPYVSTNEAQVVSGDSGGAVFVKQAGAWNLAGIIIAQGLLPNQPGGSTTAAFYNTSYFADLSYYRPQIVAIVVPEPVATTQLLAAGGIGLGVWRCRRRRAS